jgi:hypothetical protein
VKRVLRLVVVAALAVWAWRRLVRRRRSAGRATVTFSDGSAIVFEPGSPEFEGFASVASTVVGR